MYLFNSSIIIHGRQGGGKTMFATFLASHFLNSRIYGNVGLSINDFLVSKKFDSMDQLQSFSYHPMPGVMILDEIGINFNSKKGASEKNEQLTNWFFLCRKYNLSPIFVSQRFGSIPVDMRQLSTHIFLVSSIPRKGQHPLFKIETQELDKEYEPYTIKEVIFDLISYQKKYGISYNTLESSLIS